MLYPTLFLVRYLPFWAIPTALVWFELGTYYYNRRERTPFIISYLMAGLLVVGSMAWIGLEGYWRAGPWIKRMLELL